MANELMTVKQVAAFLNLKGKTIYLLVKQGKLKALKIGNRTIRFDPDYINSLKDGAL